MFFFLSKLFWMLVQPVTLVFLLMLIGWLLVMFGRRRLGLVTGGIGIILLGFAGFTTFGVILLLPLESRFTRPAEMPTQVDAIVMLGGATSGRISTIRQIAELTDAGDRLTETLMLARLYPTARVVLSGGSGLLVADGESEVEIAARFFTAQGIAPERLLLESVSRNTDENADLTKAALGDAPGTLLLVTSAYHMPRSVGLFRKVGIEAIAWPTDYRSAGNEGLWVDVVNPALNLTLVGLGMKEWIGLAVYHWTGRTDELFPAQAAN